MLSSGQDFGKTFLDSKHVLKVYFKPSRKNQKFLFLPLPSLPVWLPTHYLRRGFVSGFCILEQVLGHFQTFFPRTQKLDTTSLLTTYIPKSLIDNFQDLNFRFFLKTYLLNRHIESFQMYHFQKINLERFVCNDCDSAFSQKEI